MDGSVLDGIGCLVWLCVPMFPLGIWKSIEIVIWICHHVHIG